MYWPQTHTKSGNIHSIFLPLDHQPFYYSTTLGATSFQIEVLALIQQLNGKDLSTLEVLFYKTLSPLHILFQALFPTRVSKKKSFLSISLSLAEKREKVKIYFLSAVKNVKVTVIPPIKD